jgi:hypothetical protein
MYGKMKLNTILFASMFVLGSTIPVVAEQTDYRPGGMSEESCFKYEYREEYVPGTRKNPGYVKSYRDKVEVPCRRGTHRPRGHHGHIEQSTGPVDDNSCVEGSILGGITGGALGGVLATKDNWIWSIPAGVIGGAMTGCQIDGG